MNYIGPPWECPRCKFINSGACVRCIKCSIYRDQLDEWGAKSRWGKFKFWLEERKHA